MDPFHPAHILNFFVQYDYIGKMAVIDYALETIDHIDNPKDIISKFLRYFPTNDFLMDTLIAYLCDEVLYS
mgnify:CR=1 FL=1